MKHLSEIRRIFFYILYLEKELNWKPKGFGLIYKAPRERKNQCDVFVSPRWQWKYMRASKVSPASQMFLLRKRSQDLTSAFRRDVNNGSGLPSFMIFALHFVSNVS